MLFANGLGVVVELDPLQVVAAGLALLLLLQVTRPLIFSLLDGVLLSVEIVPVENDYHLSNYWATGLQ